MSERRGQIQEILRRPYHRVVVPDGPDAFLARISEFTGCMVLEPTAAEALTRLEELAFGWIESALERGQDIPEPHEEPTYSGKLMLRLPKSLHQKAAEAANRDDVSLNQFIVAAVAEQLGAIKAQNVQVKTYKPVLPASDIARFVSASSSAKSSQPIGYLILSSTTEWRSNISKETFDLSSGKRILLNS